MAAGHSKTRTYLEVVPEAEKEQLSKTWGERKGETFPAAGKLGLKLEEGNSFNRVVKFTLNPGYYHFSSGMVSIGDIADRSEVYSKVSGAIAQMSVLERESDCTPLVASNVCDWDSAYAKEVGVNVNLRNAVINSCACKDIVLTGGETANLSDQVRKTGLSWMFTLLSRYDGSTPPRDQDWQVSEPFEGSMDTAMAGTFGYVDSKFEIKYVGRMPLLHVKQQGQFVMTADGTGSKSMVCEMVDKRTDILDTLAMAGDDAPRDGAFPVAATIGVHANNLQGRKQILSNMVKAGREYSIPLLGSTFHVSNDVRAYIMNGVILSEVRESNRVGGTVEKGLWLVLLREEQRSNGITLQRKILEETFGQNWYRVTIKDAMILLRNALAGQNLRIPDLRDERTLGELVAQPSTPYFRVDSLMPKELLDTIKLRINVSSGGLTGKTRRLLEPLNLGAIYFNLFEPPQLTLILQMASRITGSVGLIPDEVAYYTWGSGNGAVVGTTCPVGIVEYYRKAGIQAKIGGMIIGKSEIRINSRAFDAIQKSGIEPLIHRYTDRPLG